MRAIMRKKKKSAHRTVRWRNNIEYNADASELLLRKKFYSDNMSRYIRIKSDDTARITIPANFAISTNPDEVIYILKKIFNFGLDPSIKEIVFDHLRCTNLGIAASTIMDTVVLAAKSYRRKHGGKNKELTIAGTYPEDEYTKDVFIGSGLVRHLNIRVSQKADQARIKRFKLISGKSGRQESAVVATKLTNYFNDCLKTQKYVLSDSGEHDLAAMFSEVLDNCERHGGRDAVWYALGHYQMRRNCDYGEFQLTIFNFGDSIYEQLCGNETTAETKKKLRQMNQRHARNFSGNWNQETMYTVFSLQEGVSRLRSQEKIGFKTRGLGTITLMNMFYQLGQTIDEKEPELEIVSGHTFIKFDGTYRPEKKVIQDEIFEGKERQIIAFNRDNDIYKPADSNVICLKEFFPGTIIAMKFYLDKKYMDAARKEEAHG